VTTMAREHDRTGTTSPRLGFLGVGWIGRKRMNSVIGAKVARAWALSDSAPDSLEAAAGDCPGALRAGSLADLLRQDIDGLVIATPSALHAEQAIAALERRIPVFCQKPLARTAAETARVIDAARCADRLLGVDFSYRYTEAFKRVQERIDCGELGKVFAIDLTFHNAYGPDKPWFRDPALAGGGCLLDLGVHLVDLALLALRGPKIDLVRAHLYSKGAPVCDPSREIEDFAASEFVTTDGCVVRLSCSWWLNAGQDAVIEAAFHGESAGALIRNVNGSFHDFRAELLRGTKRETLANPPDEWGGGAIVDWARRLGKDNRFDPAIDSALDVARVIDRMYGR
jgi:predicted dehydrogenase